jgi:hypothetical protein
MLPNFDTILRSLHLLESSSRSTSASTAQDSSGLIIKKRRIGSTHGYGDDTPVGSGRGFSGGLKTRYLSEGAKAPAVPRGGEEGAIMCRAVLMQILGA